MSKHYKPIFLLGGRDLEMVEIRKLLESEGYKEGKDFFDNELTWETAKLSAYKNRLNKFSTYYAIELDMDLEGYSNVKIIDHHGALNDNDASLLQVIKILGKTPTREQELIAANDARYIEGMKCIGATYNEIVDIRKRDREAQGINYSDEIAGKNDAKSKKIINDIAIVCATTPYFSTITDSLYLDFEAKQRQSKTIIYNDSKMVFYGFPILELKSLCEAHNIKEDGYYFGGGENGYFGIKDNYINTEIGEKMKEEIIEKYKEASLPYSSHVFMFPFRFDYIAEAKEYKREYEFYKDKHINQRINIKELLKQLHTDDDWRYEEFNLDKVLKYQKIKYYNEFSYFYDYAKEALYNLSPFPNDSNEDTTFYNDEISYYFEHQDFVSDKEDNRLRIKYKKCDMPKCYDLQIDGISLRVFQTGIAVLSLEIENYNYSTLEDIKNINEFGRRFYPQYLTCENDIIGNPDFLAQSIEIIGTKDKILEEFSTKSICIENTNQIKIGNHITKLLGKSFTQNLKENNSFYIQHIMDDRMFVMSWYGNDDFINRIKRNEVYSHDDSWYEYIFVDKHDNATVKNEWMKNELIYNATYDRWSEYGTMFGITRYSFVALTSANDFGKKTIRTHINTMYFQMMLLLLVIRASILRFSDEISAIANLNDTDSAKRLSSLYEKYLRFYNRIYFKEVTHQDQGIELYDMALKQMKIPEHIKKLDGKFTKLFEYAKLKEEEKQIEIKEKENNIKENFNSQLSMLGAVFLLPSLMLGILSMSIFDYTGVEYTIWWITIPLILSIFSAYALIKKCYGCSIALFFIPLLVVYYNIEKLHDKLPPKVQVSQCIYKTNQTINKNKEENNVTTK